MSKPTLLLIDGHALAYRGYYALPATLKTRTGELTNAVYGFTSMLLNVWRDTQPDYIVVTFDVGKTFRHNMYADYKATRAETPEELAGQLDRIQQVVKAFNLPVVTAEGFEADDVLGTLSAQATSDGLQTIIATGDTDAFQLIGPDVHVLTPQRKWSKGARLYDEPAVRERYGGLSPRQLIDYKALVGDTSDNIPGVKGVGDKTATQLLRQYGTLEDIYAHLDEITSKRVRTVLEAERESAFLSKVLVTIKTDVPLDIDWDQCRTTDFDRDRVLALFRELEFRSLMSRLPSTGTLSEVPPKGTGGKEQKTGTQGDDKEKITIAYVVADEAALEALAAELRRAAVISFDVETTSTDSMRASLVGISLAMKKGEGYYIPVGHQLSTVESSNAHSVPAKPPALSPGHLKQLSFFPALEESEEPGNAHPTHAGPTPPPKQPQQLPLETVLSTLRPILADPSVPKIGHNAKYDMTVLARYGAPVEGVIFDTMVAEWLIDPGEYSQGLKTLAWKRLGLEMTEIEELISSGRRQITMDRVPVQDAAAYAAADADVPLRMRPKQEAELHEKGLWSLFEQVEMPLVPVLMDMEMAGVLLDVDFLRQMSVDLDKWLAGLEREIIDLARYDFNINSPQQLADVLFGKLQLKAPAGRKTATGRVSVAQDVLESMIGLHPIIEHILEHRQLSKLKGTYVDALPALVNPETGRLHTSYNQAGTVTGRISSSDPNLQNIPIRTELGRQVRRAFIAAPGQVLVVADYSQVELRVLAHICDDPGLKEAFGRGEDIHASTASAIFDVPIAEVTSEQRRIAKSINFGLAYGQSAYGLAQVAGISHSDARKFIEAYFKRFVRVRTYIEETKRKAAAEGYVETVMGRRRYFPILQSDSRDHRLHRAKRAAEREAINMPVQGSAADIIKVAMIKLHDRLSKQEVHLKARMILQVHDELVLETPKEAAEEVIAVVREEMENAYQLDVPLKVDAKAGQNWEEAK